MIRFIYLFMLRLFGLVCLLAVLVFLRTGLRIPEGGSAGPIPYAVFALGVIGLCLLIPRFTPKPMVDFDHGGAMPLLITLVVAAPVALFIRLAGTFTSIAFASGEDPLEAQYVVAFVFFVAILPLLLAVLLGMMLASRPTGRKRRKSKIAPAKQEVATDIRALRKSRMG